MLLGPIKSYDTLNDILEESRYYTNVPLNEQVVLELDQPGLNYFIASVQFANNTIGVYSNIMDNKGSQNHPMKIFSISKLMRETITSSLTIQT